MRLFLLNLLLFTGTLGFSQSVDRPLTFVKEMPYFPECKGGVNSERDICTRKKISTYINLNFVYPEEAREKNIQGTVYVQFVVNTLGKVEQVKVKKGVHPLLDDAAVQAVKKLPDFVPGKQLEKPVAIIYSLPVKVSFDESPADKRKAKREKRKG